MSFHPIPDFTRQSLRPGRCALSGLTKQKGETVLRGPEVTYHDRYGVVSAGFFDVRDSALTESAVAAGTVVPKDQYEGVVLAKGAALARAEKAESRCEVLEERVRSLAGMLREAGTPSYGAEDYEPEDAEFYGLSPDEDEDEDEGRS